MLAERAGMQLDKPRAAPGRRPTKSARSIRPWTGPPGNTTSLLVSGPQAEVARRYFAERSITAAEHRAVSAWAIRPTSGTGSSRPPGSTAFTPALLEKADVVGRRQSGSGHYDWFRNRVLFPIFDPQGRAIAMGGRVLPGPDADKSRQVSQLARDARYSPRAICSMVCTWPATRSAKPHTALVMEGYTDVVVAHQCGFENAVAVLGHGAGLRSRSACLQRFADRLRIVLVLDGDEAGRRAGQRSAGIVRGRECRRPRADPARRVRPLPSFCSSAGPQAFAGTGRRGARRA